MKRHTIWMAPILAFCLIFAACGDANEGGEGTVVALDTTRIDTGDPNVKIKRLTEQLKLGPKNWMLWFERAQLQYEVGNADAAMFDVSKAIEYGVTKPDAYHFRGFLHFAKKEDSLALRDFQRSVEMGSENPETFHNIGHIRLFQKKFPEALEAYDRAISLDSMQATYYFSKGYLYLTDNKTDKAIASYDMALRRDPTFIKALLGLHDVYLLKKDPDRAYTYNERVLLIDSLQPVAHYNQGNFFLTRANKITEPSKMPDFQVLLKIALSEYNLAIKYDPNYGQALYNRGYVFFLLEKYSLALEDFSRVISLDPFNEKAFFMKASIQEFQGDKASALENYKRALEIDPNFSDAARAVKELSLK